MVSRSRTPAKESAHPQNSANPDNPEKRNSDNQSYTPFKCAFPHHDFPRSSLRLNA